MKKKAKRKPCTYKPVACNFTQETVIGILESCFASLENRIDNPTLPFGVKPPRFNEK